MNLLKIKFASLAIFYWFIAGMLHFLPAQQDSISSEPKTDEIFLKVEQEPAYPGGMEALYKKLAGRSFILRWPGAWVLIEKYLCNLLSLRMEPYPM